MKWKTISLNDIKQSFLNKYFIGASVFLVIMLIINCMGNPKVGEFYIHFIPEICAFYLLGFWSYYQKFSFRSVLFIYFTSTFLTPILANGFIDFMLYVIVLPIPMIIASPMLYAYYLAKKDAKINEFSKKESGGV
jgi:hypothetical protein